MLGKVMTCRYITGKECVPDVTLDSLKIVAKKFKKVCTNYKHCDIIITDKDKEAKMNKIIDCKEIRKQKLASARRMIEQFNIKPKLVIISASNDFASEVYIKNKVKACEEVGVEVKVVKLDENSNQQVLETLVMYWSHNASGLIVQLPLDKKFNERRAIDAIADNADVDCLKPTNLGKVFTGEQDRFFPCTAEAVLDTLISENLEGKHVVIVGRSNLVGKPLSTMLEKRNATVTLCHSKTRNLSEITKMADILIVAVGKPKFITAEYIKEGAVLVDVGINRDENGKVCGDIDFDSCYEKCGKITKVPGGVGLLTVATLVTNTVKAELYKDKGIGGE